MLSIYSLWTNGQDHIIMVGMQQRQPFLMGALIIIAAWWVGGAACVRLFSQLLPDTLTGRYLSLNSSFIPFIIALVLVIRKLLSMGWGAFIADGKRISAGLPMLVFLLWLLIFSLSTFFEYRLDPGRFTRGAALPDWARFLPILLLVTPLQTAAEELLFRAYLARWMQQARIHRALIILFSGLLFLSVHLLNPEISRYGDTLWIYLYYLLFGSSMMAIALAEGSFLLPIVIHTANNLFSIAIVNYEGTVLAAPSLFIDTVPDPMVSCITLSIGVLATFGILKLRIDRSASLP